MIDWTLIPEIIHCPKPFQVATQRLCSGSDSTISIVSMIVPRMIEHCRMHQCSPLPSIREASISLARKLTNYASEIYSPLVNMATALNPRYELMEMTHETSNTVRNDLKLVMESMEE